MFTNDFNRVLVFVALAVLTPTSNADTLTGRVGGVADGDTLTLLDANNTQHKVRLSGIDSPEKSKPFGEHYKKSLSQAGGESSNLYRYGRVLSARFS